MAFSAGTLPLSTGNAGIWLRELCTHDELSITDLGTLGAIDLLNRLLAPTPGGSGPAIEATQLPTADRDRLLAVVYRQLYGTRIDSTITCPFCTEQFDVAFQLDDLLAFSQPTPGDTIVEPGGLFRLADGTHFRLPTGADELAVMHLPADQAVGLLLQRCLPNGTTTDLASIQDAMQAVAPLLDMDLGAQCPECGKAQSVQFSMQSFLLNRLKNEQPQVVADIHQIAATYRWAHAEITALPRRLRQQYVGFIQSERSPADRWLS